MDHCIFTENRNDWRFANPCGGVKCLACQQLDRENGYCRGFEKTLQEWKEENDFHRLTECFENEKENPITKFKVEDPKHMGF